MYATLNNKELKGILIMFWRSFASSLNNKELKVYMSNDYEKEAEPLNNKELKESSTYKEMLSETITLNNKELKDWYNNTCKRRTYGSK